MDKRQSDALIRVAQKTFIKELGFRIDEMENLLISCEGKCNERDTQHILRFFHLLNGTAATLGLNNMASIGRRWEHRIKDLLRKGKTLDLVTLKDIHLQIIEIKEKVGFLLEDEEPGSCARPENNYINLPDRGKVLLVDDDVAILKLLENALTMEGYSVYICDDSESAMDFIAVTRPDIVILDIMMPEVDGFELLKKIKTKPELSSMHVIFLSSIKNIDDKIKGISLGADDYITKPFIIAEVVAKIETILKRSNKFKEKLLKDDLTGAYSRHFFKRRLDEEIERYKNEDAVFSIAIIDMDHYKVINEKYGYLAGDIVLKALGAYLIKNTGESGGVFRYGGQQFIVLLPGIAELEAFSMVDNLRKNFGQRSIPVAATFVSPTFSAGIMQVDERNITEDQLTGNAYRAMYQAKKQGRNRVVIYNEEMGPQKSNRTLLLVDDENIILRLLKDRLSNTGYRIITAKDGKSAIELTCKQNPDAMVLDIVLPDINGFDVCRQIKNNKATCATKVMMLSRKRGRQNIAQGFYAGADDYLTKPFSMDELEARITGMLNN